MLNYSVAELRVYNGQNYLELHNGIIVSRQSLNSQQGGYVVSRYCHFFSLLAVCLFQGRQINILKRNRHRRIGEDINLNTNNIFSERSLALLSAPDWYRFFYHPFRADYSFLRINRTQNVLIRILYQTHERQERAHLFSQSN